MAELLKAQHMEMVPGQDRTLEAGRTDALVLALLGQGGSKRCIGLVESS